MKKKEEQESVDAYYQKLEIIMPELRTYVYACFMPNILKVQTKYHELF